MELTTEAGGTHHITSVHDLERELEALDDTSNTYAILSQADEVYIQAASQDGMFIIEKRQGSEARHLQAVRRGAGASNLRKHFTRPELVRLFAAYFKREPSPIAIEWEQLQLPSYPKWLPWLLIATFVAALLYTAFDVIRRQVEIIRDFPS